MSDEDKISNEPVDTSIFNDPDTVEDGLVATQVNVSDKLYAVFRLLAGTTETAGFLFKHYQLNDGWTEYSQLVTNRLESFTDIALPDYSNDARFAAIDELPVTWGLPRYRVKLWLDGTMYWQAIVTSRVPLPLFDLSGTWTKVF